MCVYRSWEAMVLWPKKPELQNKISPRRRKWKKTKEEMEKKDKKK
jgi:hypothetical protein